MTSDEIPAEWQEVLEKIGTILAERDEYRARLAAIGALAAVPE
ncbi:hypothetical protein [Rhodococcus sp. (in: high G+C Gram-positive bacteria)]|nr:hypothetical protein [Rhodococcus sp. (in: high G+C Gram-positive bacteria)]